MENSSQARTIEIRKKELEATIAELLGISQKREKELQEMDRIAKMLVRRDFALMKIREKREIELKELKKTKEELGEIRTALEVKVKARTKKLEELTRGLGAQVEERTKELRKKVDELERMNKLMIGRELKMIELKKEIKELKSQSEKGVKKQI